MSDADAAAGSGKTPGTLVWDLPTRLFHWALVLLLGASWLSAHFGRMELHHWSGYGIGTLLLFRLAWGFVGPCNARFGSFLAGPQRVLDYLRDWRAGSPPALAGHTPPGGWMIVLMLLLLCAQVATGMMNSHDGLDAGPWYYAASRQWTDFAHAWHPRFFDAMLVLAVLHVGAVLLYRLWPGVDLIGPMFSGRKRVAAAGIPGSRPLLAATLIAAAAAAMWLIVSLAPPPSLADLGIY